MPLRKQQELETDPMFLTIQLGNEECRNYFRKVKNAENESLAELLNCHALLSTYQHICHQQSFKYQ